MLGRPHVRLVHQECSRCGQVASLEFYRQEVPPRGNYAYDLMVAVGLARFRDHRQNEEIQGELQRRWGLSLPASSVGLLAGSFLDGLAAIHQAHAPTLRRQMEEDGGYIMHADGTCEAGTDVLFTTIAEPRGWMLEAGKMPSENSEDIGNLLKSCAGKSGSPLAVVSDLSSNIAKAIQEAIPEARHLICHYHFLENVGTKLCEKPHAKLTTALRRVRICPTLRSIRTDLVRWSRKGKRISAEEVEYLLFHTEEIVDLDPVALRRYVAYLALRWLDDYKADLQGEYFPFDLPQLAFYRRAVRLEKVLSKLVVLSETRPRELSTFNTIAAHLRLVRENAEVVAAAARLEKAAAMFEELRQVLRLSSQPDQSLFRGRGPQEGARVAKQMEKQLENWRDRLRERHDRERDEQKRADQGTVLEYLEKYEKQLVGHVIELDGDRPPLVASRTNNSAEHRFGVAKRGIRRKVGLKKLTRQLETLRPEAFLTWNLANRDYMNLVLEGSLTNLAPEMAKHWDLVQENRQRRSQPASEHPMPTTKKQLRHPQLLESVKKIIATIVQTVVETPQTESSTARSTGISA